MPRDSLLDVFEDFSAQRDTFVVHDDGYRVRSVTYADMGEAARGFADRLQQAGIGTGDNVVIWSENRPEWIAAFWGCLRVGAVVVPVDYRASGDLMQRIAALVQPRAMLVGDDVDPPAGGASPIWRLHEVVSFEHRGEPAIGHSPPAPRQSSALAEIIFTSGATAEPKGVTITDRNLLANLLPIEREVRKYRRLERVFHPVRFLSLLPMSHLFGQSMGVFIPSLIGGTVIFSPSLNPAEIVRQIASRRVSVLVCVPKVLEVLREHITRIAPTTAEPDPLAGKRWFHRWWYYRRVHRILGWKFWCVIVGAAPLDPREEAFWRKLGYLVIQGYGLTETAPIVTLNHPFHASKGTVGTPIGGVNVRIADDGEVLVRGDNVTSGYYVPPGREAGEPAVAFADGWFHTGDVGEIDGQGRLIIKGRKKEMIATAQGLKVFPEDVERVLLSQPGVIDAAVVGIKSSGEERVHAVLVTAPHVDVDAVVRGANAQLEDFQRVWSASVWPGPSLPRTEGTQKLRRVEVQRWAAGETSGRPPAPAPTGVTVQDVVRRYAASRELTPQTSLEELGLSSLDRVELMMALESEFRTTIEESAVSPATSVGDLERLVGAPGAAGAAGSSENLQISESANLRIQESVVFPSWNRTSLSWFLRRISLPTWILPLDRVFIKLRVEGLEHLKALKGPVIFAANHQSHMDVPTLMIAMPRRWRYNVAPAMSKEFFAAHFYPAQYGRRAWSTNTLNYVLACQFFNAFPLPQREAGTRQTLRYIGEVAADGYSIILFPEGRRTEDGSIAPFRAGVGMMASRLELPVVPVRIDGLDKVLHHRMKWPKRGPVRIAFGAALTLTGDDYPALAKQVEEAVKRL